MGQVIKNEPLSPKPTEEFKRQKKNVFKILFPVLTGAIATSVIYFSIKHYNDTKMVRAAKAAKKKAEELAAQVLA